LIPGSPTQLQRQQTLNRIENMQASARVPGAKVKLFGYNDWRLDLTCNNALVSYFILHVIRLEPLVQCKIDVDMIAVALSESVRFEIVEKHVDDMVLVKPLAFCAYIMDGSLQLPEKRREVMKTGKTSGFAIGSWA
jgi:hypothetical protein